MDKIILHSCCAPCSGAIIEYMVDKGMRPTVFFSNSNIVPKEEYELRKSELLRYCEKFGLEVVDDDYDHSDWLDYEYEGRRIREMGAEPERGARCSACFRYRLLRAARYAAEHGFDTLTTSLASSRWKDIGQVNAAGVWACRQVADTMTDSASAPSFWEMNWRKGGLQPRRCEIIREQNFYNQTFCGCEFSREK
ncbi:MAG: epoxyqueuosine reductase QueH [Bacteroidales bacterium]|nr:epoxyqueuosine reductase QueH [Bacteroidales bacterium]